MLVRLGTAQRREVRERFIAFRVDGLQPDLLPRQRCDAAAREDVHREVDGDGAGMKKVERPDVHRPAGQVHAAGAVRYDRALVRHHSPFAAANTSAMTASTSRSVVRWFTMQARNANFPWIVAFDR